MTLFVQANKTVVVIGAGFAGTTVVRQLERKLPKNWRLILISEESYTTFNPMLAEVVGAGVFPEHVIAPVREMLKSAQFIMGRVQRVDYARRVIQCDTLAGSQDIAFDHLVLAFGQRANMDVMPGMAEHALPLKLVGDAMYIRNRILQRLACMELTQDADERRALGAFVVVGGGFSGVEVAGAMADFVRSALRFYPRVDKQDIKISLLHNGERLLPELPAALGDSAASSLMSRGVTVRCGLMAESVNSAGVVLAGGVLVPARTVICTIGVRPNPLTKLLGLALVRGRIAVAEDGRVKEHAGVWALGDCAATPLGTGGAICPPTAQFAVAQAEHTANNILAQIAQRSTQPFHYKSRGMMATTGHLKGVAQVFGINLSGMAAWLAWRGYYLMLMPTLGRKVRIWVEWTWAMFFPLDITHLRFTRTHEVDPPIDRPMTQPPTSAANSPLHSAFTSQL